jgi:hypothetical protein
MTLFLWAVLAAACAALMWALVAFDRLIDIGSAAAGDRKTGSREVKGRAISGTEGSSFRNGMSRNRLFMKWLFRTPGWAGDLRGTRSLFQRFRIGSAIAFVGFVSFGAGVFLHL